MKNKNKVNIRDIATACNISASTVSRYFNNPDLLSASTREKIDQKLKELNFQPSWSMQMRETGTTNLIAVILPNLQFGFYTELLHQLVEKGKAKGYHFIPYTSKHSKKKSLPRFLPYAATALKGLSC